MKLLTLIDLIIFLVVMLCGLMAGLMLISLCFLLLSMAALFEVQDWVAKIDFKTITMKGFELWACISITQI